MKQILHWVGCFSFPKNLFWQFFHLELHKRSHWQLKWDQRKWKLAAYMCLPSFSFMRAVQLCILWKEGKSQIVQQQKAGWRELASASLGDQLATLAENIQRYKHMQTQCLNKELENTVIISESRSFQWRVLGVGVWSAVRYGSIEWLNFCC